MPATHLLSPACAIVFLSVVNLAAAGSGAQLLRAARNADVETVRALLKQGADVNARQGDGGTALHWAAHREDAELVDVLIRAGAKVNAKNELGATPLWVGSVKASTSVMEILLRNGADPNAALINGETPLMTASRAGGEKAVQLLLAHGANVNAQESFRAQTALMWAVAQQHPKVVQILIEHGANIHQRSHAWPQLISTSGFADPSGVHEIAQGGFTALLFAARHGDLESAKLLLAAGANANEEAPAGTSALVVAAHSGHGALARYLLEKGADPNARKAGYAPIHAAVLRGDVELVMELLSYSANANIPLEKGTFSRRSVNGSEDWALSHQLIGATPYWLAARFAEPAIMRALVAKGAIPTVMKDRTTALMAALEGNVSRGRFGGRPPDDEESRVFETVKLAVELGADVNAANALGNTPLHGAASRGFDGVVEFLVQRGATLHAKNRRGQTPLAMTASQERAFDDDSPARTSTADLLRKLGAKE